MWQPEASLRGRLAMQVHEAMEEEMGLVSSPAATSRRWAVAYNAADRLIAAGVTDGRPDASTHQPRRT